MKNNDISMTRRTLYEDNLFREAAKEAARIEGERLLRENTELGPEIEGISIEKQREFRRSLEKAFRDKKRRAKRKTSMAVAKRAAIIVLVLSAMLTVSLITSEAFRVKFLNFFMEINPEYTEFWLEDHNENRNTDELENQYVDWSDAYAPTYIPEGYWVESAENGNSIKAILFINNDGKIINYAQYSEGASFHYDTEDADLQDITINGAEGKIIIKESNYSIIWNQDNSIFVVLTQINKEETLKIAESIKFFK